MTVVETLKYSMQNSVYPSDTPRYPLVLCHGFSGFDGLLYIPSQMAPPSTVFVKPNLNLPQWLDSMINKQPISPPPVQSAESAAKAGKFMFEYWNGIKSHLELSNKCQYILIAKVPPFANITTRALALHNHILNHIDELSTPENSSPVKINLIAHSMGGLDARLLINNFNNESNDKYQIVSLTTLSTPHHGTAAAVLAHNLVPPSFIERFFPSIAQLTPEYASLFNQFVKDDPSVKYFSYGAEFQPTPASMFYLTWLYVNKYEGANDGLISLKSAHWGKWMGYVPDVDHADLINWSNPLRSNMDFNVKLMYSDIVSNLYKNGL